MKSLRMPLPIKQLPALVKRPHAHLLPLLFALLMLANSLPARSAAESNIFIPETNTTIVLSADKSGTKVTRIKQSISTVFRARRVAGEALAYTFYDDHRSIDKAKAKGAKPVYTSATSAGIFFDDSRVCVLNIPIEEPGKDVEAVFEITINRPSSGALYFLGSEYPVEKQCLTYRMPASLKGIIDVEGRNLTPAVHIERELTPDGKEYVITVTATDLKETVPEEGSPGARNVYPYIRLTGLYGSVGDLYTALREFIPTADPDSASITAKALEVTQGCTDTASRIEAIHDWVNDNIRYIAIEHGILGLKPDMPSEVLRKRFGDCKGSAALIKAMLHAVGIDGRIVWIGTDKIPEDWTEAPLFSTGNHMIAAAVLPDTIVYIDGTVGMGDFGIYSPSIQGKQTIIENGESPIVGRVPVLPPHANTDSTHVSYAIDGKSLSGCISKSITGSIKARTLNTYNYIAPAERNKMLARFLRNDKKNVTVDSITMHNAAHGGGPTVISANITAQNAITQAGGKFYLSPGLLPEVSSMPVTAKDRTQPLRLSARTHTVHIADIAIPQELTVTKLPADYRLENDRWEMSLTYENNPGSVRVTASFTVKERLVPLDEIQEHNNQLMAFAKALSQRIILEPNQQP